MSAVIRDWQGGTVATVRRRASTWRIVVRFVVGMHLDGRRRTDATFFARGTQALTPRWFGRAEASKWAMMPGWQRSAIRLAVVAAAAGLWHWREVTEWALALAGGPALGVAAFVAVRRAGMARHRARVVVPLSAALAGPLESTPAELARTLAVPRRPGPAAEVTTALPDHWQGTPAQLDAAARIVGQRLGGEWQARVARAPWGLIVGRRPAPPERVAFADVADLIHAQGSATRILAGLGAGGEPVWLDFGAGGGAPNLGLSVPPGGGKSAFLRYVVAQFAHHGVADFPVIDSKFVSLAGMDAPGLRVYREPAEQWAALAEARADMDARYRALLADPSARFPLRVVLLEEQNDAAMEWADYWRSIKGPRDPATPPVYSDITRLLVKGRQADVRVIGVYQRMTARACGGIDATVARDAYGAKALGGAFGPGAWDTLTGIRPRAEASAVPGRFVFVIGSEVRAVQVPFGEPGELAEFARSGAAPAAPWTPPPAPPPSAGRPRLVAVSGDGTADVRPAPPPASETPGVVVGLAAAAELLGMNLEAFRKARQRRPVPGELAADDYGRPRWPAEALTAWRAARPSAAGDAEGAA